MFNFHELYFVSLVPVVRGGNEEFDKEDADTKEWHSRENPSHK